MNKKNRLKREKDIKKLFSKGKSVFDVAVGAKVLKNGLRFSRFVVIVGTKVHKRAYRRNRIRRRVRSILQTHMNHIAIGYDIAIIAKPEALSAKFEELDASVIDALKKTSVLNDPQEL